MDKEENATGEGSLGRNDINLEKQLAENKLELELLKQHKFITDNLNDLIWLMDLDLNTVWISPFPYEHLFTNIKKDLNLTTELMILVTDKLDPETNLAFLEAVKNNKIP